MMIAMSVASTLYLINTLITVYRKLRRGEVKWLKSYLPISAVCYVLLLVSLFIYYSLK